MHVIFKGYFAEFCATESKDETCPTAELSGETLKFGI